MFKYFAAKCPIPKGSVFSQSTEEPVETQFGSIQSYKWYQGTSKSEGVPTSIFKYSYGAKDNHGCNLDQEFAERHLRGIRLLLHPNILKVIKIKQSNTSITIATERCYPLSASSISFDPALGFYQIFSAIHFLHTKCNKAYGLITPLGVVVRDDGSWCLSSFECSVDNETSVQRLIADLKQHASWREGWRPSLPSNAAMSARKLDQWGLGALMCWVYTLLSGNVERCNFRKQELDIQALRRYAPTNLHVVIDQLMSPDHDVNLQEVLDTHPYFCSNVTVSAITFALAFHIKTEPQIREFFANLPASLPRIPIEIACKQLLPEILKVMYIHKSLVPSILESVVPICKSILVDEFKAKVYPHISSLFKDNDRSIRFSLLKLMPELEPLLDERDFSEDLFEPMIVGFSDSSSQIRDETVKTMVHVMKKINRRQQQSAVMLLCKCVEDIEPTIRVNSIICLAKIIPYLQNDLVLKVIPQVWRTGLQDPFLKSRFASLESIAATYGFFGIEKKVEILLPLACSTLLDGDQQVRKLGMDTVYAILESLKGHVLTGESKQDATSWAGGAQPQSTPTQNTPKQGIISPRSSSPRTEWSDTDAGKSITRAKIPSPPDAWAASATHVQPQNNSAWGTTTNDMMKDPMHELQDFFDPFPAKK